MREERTHLASTSPVQEAQLFVTDLVAASEGQGDGIGRVIGCNERRPGDGSGHERAPLLVWRPLK